MERRSWMGPCLATRRLMLLSSSVEWDMSSATSLKVSATLPAMPVQPSGRRVVKLPFLRPIKAERICSASRELVAWAGWTGPFWGLAPFSGLPPLEILDGFGRTATGTLGRGPLAECEPPMVAVGGRAETG